MPSIDWQSMFVPSVDLLSLIIRTTLVFVALLAGLRILHRDAGQMSPTDLLVIIFVGDIAVFAMDVEANSVTEAVVMLGTVFTANYLLDWLASRFSWAHRLLHAPPLPLIRNGVVQRKNLRRELMTIDDLRSQLREHGVEDFGNVKKCFLEPDGKISVVTYEPGGSASES